MTQPQTSAAVPIELAALIGIDWADQKHAVCLSVAGSDQIEQTTLDHTPEALADWIGDLRQRFGGRPVGICLEQTRGALIHALLVHDFLVLYPINPATAKRYRQAFATSGAKDDPVDAQLLWELLAKHRDRLRPWTPDDAQTRKLALLCEHRRKLVNARTALVQRLTAALKAYFPQALGWVGDDLASPMACDFLIRWPTLEALQKARPQTIRNFYYAHHCRRPDRIAERLAQIQTARPLTTDSAVVEAHALFAVTLARQLRALSPSVGEYDRQIAALFASHPDAAIFESFPVRARPSPRGCWRLSASTATASPIPTRCPNSAASPRSPTEAVKPYGSIVVTPVPVSSYRPSTSLLVAHVPSAPGPPPTTKPNAPKARATMRPCAHWRSSGCAFSGAVGVTVCRTTKPTIWSRCSGTARRWPQPCNRCPCE